STHGFSTKTRVSILKTKYSPSHASCATTKTAESRFSCTINSDFTRRLTSVLFSFRLLRSPIRGLSGSLSAGSSLLGIPAGRAWRLRRVSSATVRWDPEFWNPADCEAVLDLSKLVFLLALRFEPHTPNSQERGYTA